MKNPVSYLLILLLKLYKGAVSPYLPRACRYTPTCSEYGMEAIKKHGPFKGTLLTLKRVSRCHPLGGHGHDPVP